MPNEQDAAAEAPAPEPPAPAPPAAGPPATPAPPTVRLTFAELASVHQQQLASVNSLWTMYAVTTFTAGAFTFNVDKGPESAPLLLAGAFGFLFFTIGHAGMVWSAIMRLKRIALEIKSLATPAGGTLAPESLVGYLALPVGPGSALLIHILIDLCVFAIFDAQMRRLGNGPLLDYLWTSVAGLG
jgi:hypothetical protein